jgi:hypothetical protein
MAFDRPPGFAAQDRNCAIGDDDNAEPGQDIADEGKKADGLPQQTIA